MGNTVDVAVESYEGGWYGLAKMLKEIQKQSLYWPDHSNFTNFLDELADKIDLNVRTLRRFIKAYAIIHEIVPEILTLDEPLKTISGYYSPHSLEQLHQLRQVMPQEVFNRLRSDFVANKLKRDYLRAEWKNFKTAVTVATKRRSKKNEDSSPSIDNIKVQKAVAIKQAREYIQQSFPLKAEGYKLIILTASQWQGIPLPAFDLICIERQNKEKLPAIHGVCTVIDTDSAAIDKLISLADCCDYFWLSSPVKIDGVREDIGLICPYNGAITKTQGPDRQPDSENKWKIMRNLLLKCQA